MENLGLRSNNDLCIYPHIFELSINKSFSHKIFSKCLSINKSGNSSTIPVYSFIGTRVEHIV